MQIKPPALLRVLRRRWRARARLSAFDPVFYLRRYADLAGLATAEEAEAHYRRHGKAEGRFANATAEEEADFRRYLTRSDIFDLVAYRALNPDLARAYAEDREFILHFIRHGRREGRAAVFTGARHEAGAAAWTHLLSVSQFAAWDGDALPPADRAEALTRFESRLSALPPLRFDLAFDPVFHRAHYAPAAGASDSELYRNWLDAGLPEGRAPNETQLLLPYMGDLPLSDAIDWRAYADWRKLTTTHRAPVLIRLFEVETDWTQAFDRIEGADAAFVTALARFRLARGQAVDANAVVAAWEARGGAWTAELWRVTGEIRQGRGKTVEARDAYNAAVAAGDTSLDTAGKAVRISITLGDFDRALELLAEGRHRWQHQMAFERLVAECIDRMFERLSAECHAMLGADDTIPTAAETMAMNAHFAAGLEKVVQAIIAHELQPARLAPPADGHVAQIGNEDLRQCTFYRIEQKQMQMAAAGIEFRRHSVDAVEVFLADLPGARAAIFYRVPATPPMMRAILTARAMGIPTYYEIDDLLFCYDHYPPPYESYGGRISAADYRGLQFGVPLFRQAMALCDRAIGSTPALLDRMTPLVREQRGLLLRNGLDHRNDAMVALGASPRADDGGRIRIFYGSGTLAHNADFSELVAPALARLMDERGDVDLILVGHVPDEAWMARHASRVMRYPIIASIDEYWAVLSACDINLAMLKPDAQADCKSEIKWLEAAMLGIPTIASGTATYRDAILPGTDGLIADGPDCWYAHLAHLAGDAALRRQIGLAARAKVLDSYSLDHTGALLATEFAPPAQPALPDKRLRVLICNVFFAPQSIGGATRVVEDNVARIAATCPDIELAVFCTDEGATPAGRLRTSQFGDVPVFRLAVPSSPDIDRIAFLPAHLAAFRQVLAQVRPHLVHFHCIQRLSASIVEQCLSSGIPYVVTVHDGWWISPHQFLVDGDGLLRLPGPDPFARVSALTPGVDEVLVRRRRLGALLSGARRVLTVSDSFADVYRHAGIADVEVVANGVPNLPAPFAPDPQSGPLRLAHIGGRSSHKGADLIEAALRYGDFPNLSLTMVDGRLAPGTRIDTRWGSSAVTISAPFAQGDIAALYAGMDVLLAPSCWPEGFGLVAREAAYFGLWVVASKSGAMGDDLEEGVNGFRIDTGNRVDLDRIMAQLNADPDLYRQGTARRYVPTRSADDQTDDLAALYRSLILG